MRVWAYDLVDLIELTPTSAPISVAGTAIPAPSGSRGMAMHDIVCELTDGEVTSVLAALRTDLLWLIEDRPCRYLGRVEVSEMRVGLNRVRISFTELEA